MLDKTNVILFLFNTIIITSLYIILINYIQEVIFILLKFYLRFNILKYFRINSKVSLKTFIYSKIKGKVTHGTNTTRKLLPELASPELLLDENTPAIMPLE